MDLQKFLNIQIYLYSKSDRMEKSDMKFKYRDELDKLQWLAQTSSYRCGQSNDLKCPGASDHFWNMFDIKRDINGAGSKKRRRQTIVCVNCRRRKTKCDKGKPCGACIKLGIQDTCRYVPELGAHLRQKDLPDLAAMVPHYESTYINLRPLGFPVYRKRSGTCYVPPLTAGAAVQRDIYLRVLQSVCSIPRSAIDKAQKRNDEAAAGECSIICASNKDLKHEPTDSPINNLPNSLRHIEKLELEAVDLEGSLASKHKQTCKHLFEKFGISRKNRTRSWGGAKLPLELMPEADLFFHHVWPFFVEYVSSLCPLFDLEGLKAKLDIFYRKDEQKKYGVDDYASFCILLLITRIVQISINLAKPADISTYSKIKNIETEHYIPVVNHYIFHGENARKCSLLRLQSMLLLRFYQWCAPDDGDGECLQQSSMLMGMIVSGSYGIGIGWQCVTQAELFILDRPPWCYSDSSQTFEDIKEYQRVWSVILHWDRKLSLLTGLPCLINTTKRIDKDMHNNLPSVTLKHDYLLEKIARTISNNTEEVDYDSIKKLSEHLRQILRNDVMENRWSLVLEFEMNIVLLLLELSFNHARVVNCETTQCFEEYQDCMQALVEKLIQVANLCEHLLEDQEYLAFARFYTNRIVELALRTVVTIIPSVILRSGRSAEAGLKTTLMKFYKAVLSAYFNNLGTDYYQAFRRMFSSKILYKTLSSLNEKDPFETILEYFTQTTEKGEHMAEPRSIEIRRFRDLYDQKGGNTRPSEVWDDSLGINKNFFSFEIDIENLSKFFPFTSEQSENKYDIFASFFTKVSTAFLKKVKTLPSASLPDSPHNILDNFDYRLLDFGENNPYDPLMFLSFFEPTG
ncbi:LAME_0G04764g1_1 [Lachancea meyersii CBS 8951]|uniref:Oleate activated transcription factor 3 n=1 Tax=Lachancea meyersii CBS 8951 TaxID=1266667 RepID=A0A1G4K721_9SACH|nr:LAME_0G04764g1_1 [Lachancea meyersii CBS 8951]